MEKLLIIISTILGIMLIGANSPVTAILSVIGLFISSAGLLAINGCSMLALFFIIIYVGAIAILFLFITFLLNLRKVDEKSDITKKVISSLLITILAATGLTIIGENPKKPSEIDVIQLAEGSDQLANLSAIYESLAFWTIGVVLLVAMIAVILLTHKKLDDQKDIIRYKTRF